MGTFPKGKIRVIRVLCGEAIGIFCDYLLIEFLYYCFQRFIAVVIAGDSWKSHATLTLLAKQDCPLWLQYD